MSARAGGVMSVKASPLIALLVSFPVWAGSDDGAMQPGQWQYTMRTVVPGVPFPLGAVTQSLCLDAEEAKYGVAWAGDDKKGSCRYENWQRAGGVTSYDMVCPDNAGVSGHFEYTATGTKIAGRGVIRSGSSEIIQQWEGSRSGDC